MLAVTAFDHVLMVTMQVKILPSTILFTIKLKMKEKKQPCNLTSPIWNWRKNFGRLRIGWMSRYNWRIYGATPIAWFFCCSSNELMDWKKNKVCGRYIQITLFGLQFAYLYSNKGYKQNESRN